MRFKYWLETEMHGGIFQSPYGFNDNMPVKSKYVTKDRVPPDSDTKVDPENLFGFKNPESRKNSRKRSIHNDRKKVVPTTVDRPDITY